MGETERALNRQKDDVVQFLKHHNLSKELLNDSVRPTNDELPYM